MLIPKPDQVANSAVKVELKIGVLAVSGADEHPKTLQVQNALIETGWSITNSKGEYYVYNSDSKQTQETLAALKLTIEIMYGSTI